MLPPALRQQLTSHLTHLRTPVDLVATLDDSPTSRQMQGLLAELASASTQIAVSTTPPTAGQRVPSFRISRSGEQSGPRFAGVPMGHEFTSLVLALLHVSGHPPKFDDDLLDQIQQLSGPLHFETYFSLTCQNCPDVVQALNTMAALNPSITHTAIEGGAFATEVADRGILSVPAVFLNGELFAQGRMGLTEIVERLGSTTDTAAHLDAKPTYDMLVVGGGPAGVTAALYAARKGLRTALVAERLGGQVLDTAGIENFPSVARTEGPRLGSDLESQVRAHEVDVIERQLAAGLHSHDDPDAPLSVELASGAELFSRTIVIATGAQWRLLDVPGEAEYRNRGVTFCPHCDGPLFKDKAVAVVGGGNSGVEAAIDLAGLASQVTLLEFGAALRADSVLQQALARQHNVRVITSAQTQAIVGDGQKVTGMRYQSRTDESLHDLDLSGVFVQIGLHPATDWLDGSLTRNRAGEIVVDHHGRTDLPGVFAAGDCTTAPYKQIVTSAGDGAKAALAAFDHLIRTALPRQATA
ncbi:alkyl hydroperoxide reductase subunit F [Nocardioides sp. Bht2]|uniref:alkyl hydroperoxide reductase subunit F n=1 Tax=Nocardioides sp. Bht2 TaxID=3392297 RepID=UPI0039B458D4